jgi:hypothetical protein
MQIKAFDSLFFIGSCFSSNISEKLHDRKFNVLSNPYGILFDTLSIRKAIDQIIYKKKYNISDLFYHKEMYGSWNHHTEFSDTSKDVAVEKINNKIIDAHTFLKNTDIVVITLGSAFSYYHKNSNQFVANCHKVPQNEFEKKLISAIEITQNIDEIIKNIQLFNPKAEIILTISPVRHLRDGVIENNRSKAQLIEAVHQAITHNNKTHYFPSYEIVIDILRDYRFFDVDYAHPNYLATEIVLQYFIDLCMESNDIELMEEMYKLKKALNHRSLHPNTIAHKEFLKTHLEKAIYYSKKYPNIDFSNEIKHFSEKS